MFKLFSQEMERTAFDQSGYVSRQGVRIGSKEQMHMVWLNGELNDVPSLLVYDILHDLFQAIFHRTTKNFATPLGAPDDVVHNQVDRVSFVLTVHVNSIACIDMGANHALVRPPQPVRKEDPFIPAMNGRGFLGRSL